MDSYYLFLIIIAAAIVETVLSVKWNKFYFLYAIPVFIKKIEIRSFESANKGISRFFNHLKTQNGFSNVIGKSISDDTFFFRSKIYAAGRRNSPPIQGTIVIDDENQQVILKGNVGSISFILLTIYVLTSSLKTSHSFKEAIPILAFLILIQIIGYALVRRKFNKMAEMLTEKLDNKQDKVI